MTFSEICKPCFDKGHYGPKPGFGRFFSTDGKTERAITCKACKARYSGEYAMVMASRFVAPVSSPRQGSDT